MSMDSKMNKREIIQIGSKMRGRKKKGDATPSSCVVDLNVIFQVAQKKDQQRS